MSEAVKFTPGPWAWGDYCEKVTPGAKPIFELVAYGPADSSGSRAITNVLELDEDSQQPKPEDARLIAAAPEMYEALKAWEMWYSEDSTEFNRETARYAGLKAIAKAEGR